MRKATCVAILSTSAISMLLSGAAFAQSTHASVAGSGTATNSGQVPEEASTGTLQDSTIGDIVVTAQRRSESLQKTAITIQVVQPATLANAGITTPTQLATILPSVQIGNSGPATSVYIRGVGGFQSTAATSPAVPYYIDGVYIARTQSVSSELYDVERLEVVKGPQGTLYGRNASGGAINVLTVNPKLNVAEGRVEGELGNYDNRSIEAVFNVPLGSKAALRASGTLVDKGGFTSAGFGDDVHQAGRLKLLWKPDSDVSLLLNGSYGHIGGKSPPVVAVNRNIAGWYPWLDITDTRVAAFVAANGVAPPPFVRNSTTADALQDLTFYNVSGQLDWRVGAVNLTLIPAYRHASMTYTGLLGFTYYNGGSIGSIPAKPQTSSATSLEARASGETGALSWLVGAYFYNEDQYDQLHIDGGLVMTNANQVTYGTVNYAAFTQNTFAISPSLRLIVGGRYTSDRRTISGNTYLVSPTVFLGPPPPAGAACAFPAPTQPQCQVDLFAARKTFHNFSWKAGLEADVFDDSLAYVTVSRGFKAGGFNSQSTVGSPGEASPFAPEKLTSYEVGLKTRLLGNRLQVNVSGFYWDYKNHQEPVITYTNVPSVTNLVYFNAGAARIYGGSIDFIARPWQGATITGAAEYAHSRYTSYTYEIPTFSYNPSATGCRVAGANPASTTLDCSGFEVARTPKWSGNLSVAQEVRAPWGTVTPSATLTFASSRWIGVDFIPLTRASAYGKLDLSISYRSPSETYSLTGFVRNVTNAVIYNDGAREPFSPLVYSNIQAPRTYGARFSVRF